MKEYSKVPFYNVDITGGFWKIRQNLNSTITINAVMNRFMETGRFEAFKCNWKEGMENRPHIFWDSDIAKWMESVAYIIEKEPAPELEKVVEETIDEIEKNQQECGYINSYYVTCEPENKWSVRPWHELYCAGHLIEAAIAWKHATGRDRFLKIICRYADYIYDVFYVNKSAAFDTPGHEEIELALIKLYHETNIEKYLDLSYYFIDTRGKSLKDKTFDRNNYDRVSNQSHIPVVEMETAEGHAVRACYLYAAMADLAREKNDEKLLLACEKIFDNIAQKRMYITGGIGSTNICEAFTFDYDLPNETAYTETCAAIALAYFANRMQTLKVDSKYADVIERVLYNGFLASTSLDGNKFFYSNPLEVVTEHTDPLPSSGNHDWYPDNQRVEVFWCSCCPPNITRFVSSVGDYIYTEDDECIYIHQFIDSKSEFSGAKIEISTEYPKDGAVKINVTGLGTRKLAVRIPGWCQNFTLNVPYSMKNGYAVLECKDYEIELVFDMTPQLIEANPLVFADAGKVALVRGPVIYCLEGKDNGELLHTLKIDPSTDYELISSDDYFVPVIKANGYSIGKPDENWLYRRYKSNEEEKKLTFIPYFAFANRGPSNMRVWVPVK